MRKILLFILYILSNGIISAQGTKINSELTNTVKIHWDTPISFNDFNDQSISILHFKEAFYNFPSDSLPQFSSTSYLPNQTLTANVNIEVLTTETLSKIEQNSLINNTIHSSIQPIINVTTYKKKQIVTVSFPPVIADPITGEVLKVTSFTYTILPSTSQSSRSTQWAFKSNSVLKSGNWAKIGVTRDGVYKVSYDELNAMGFDMTGLKSNQIRLFGNGGGYLPFDNSVDRFDDLEENAIEIVDGGDGNFNSGDYVLFYGQDPIRWNYTGTTYAHAANLFTDTTYYFISTDYVNGSPKRILKSNGSTSPADQSVNYFNDYSLHEVDLVNFVKSGRNWYGESFSFTKDQSFTFSFPNRIANSAKIKSRLAFRVIRRSSTFTMSINGTQIQSITNGGVSGGYYDYYAKIGSAENNFNMPSDNFNLDVNFSNPSTSDNGWVDYFEINCDRNLIMYGNQMPFRNEKSINASVIEYSLSNTNGVRIWNVTQPTLVNEIALSNDKIRDNGGQLNEYIAFKNSSYLSVKSFGKVANQNLHGIESADYIIVTYPLYINQANQLADFHRSNSGLNTVVVTTQQLYNEFSSGSQDITAIKSFNKMLYDRAGTDPNKMLKYVLLLGDASYDLKRRMTNNTNQVPAYQSSNSNHPLQSYVSDDYVGFLDDNESDGLNSTLDIGIGRIMANSVEQAQDIVDKTIHYMTSPASMQPWRNKITFIGDDEDSNIHMIQSDYLANRIDTNYPIYNLNKIYLDAFQQVSNAGGSTYPDVNTAVDQATEKGSLIINYVGHGGELGLAHERILGLSQIKNYNNRDALAVYVTATCEFSRFDDPDRTSAGELTLLNPNGAAVSLLTTTRLVYSAPNFELTKKFFDVAFEKVDGEWPRLGDLLRISKFGGNNINTRNFSLLGDPAAQLRYPTYNVSTTVIPDTIKSLQQITIKGSITNESNQIVTTYNGILYPTIYGQKKQQSSLNNDGNGVFQFTTQNSPIFNGKTTVTNGEFEFSFIVPKDINFSFGNGKASYYAENGEIDASGAYENFILGGIDGDPNKDQQGPTINLWMNDESFAIGGLTDENPLIYAKIYDESGVNTVGNGIGHDIVAVIDENTANSITLNEYYESELNTYQKGSISYKLANLTEGKHTLRLKAWDVYNNSSEAYTEFIVSNSGEFQIEHVLNYPNPFTTNTDFYFDHNAIGQELKVRIQILTISGKLVKTLDYIDSGESYRAGPINWNGKDEYGDRIGKGTYIYKINVTNTLGQSIEKFEKIVIL